MENFREVQSAEKNHVEILSLKNARTGFRNVIDGFNSRSDIVEVGMSKGGQKTISRENKGWKIQREGETHEHCKEVAYCEL